MKRRIFINTDLKDQEILKLNDKETIERIKKVYKLKPKDTIIFVGTDLTEGIYLFIDPKNLIFQRIKLIERNIIPKRKITLYISFIKKENFELILRKSTELGIYKIIPVICERSPWYFEKISERWLKILKTGLEVSEWKILPQIENPILLKDIPSNVIVLDKEGEKFNINYFSKESSIFVGPEGGLSEKELKLLNEKGTKFVSLGPVTLRSETAVFVILSLLNFPC